MKVKNIEIFLIIQRKKISQVITQKYSEGKWDMDSYLQYGLEINNILSPKSIEIKNYLLELEEYIKTYIIDNFTIDQQCLIFYDIIINYDTTMYDNILFMTYQYISVKFEELEKRYNA